MQIILLKEEIKITQKELLYIEDAICHEQNVIAYLNDSTNTLSDEQLISFVNEEIKKHEDIKKKLMKKLEDNSNE